MGARLERMRRERGSVLIFATIGMLAFLAFAALATDSGKVWVAHDQVRGATDSAALAGAGALFRNGDAAADPGAALAAAQSFGAQNEAIWTPINIAANDVETGNWDPDTRTFTAMPGSTDINQVNAVQVLGRRDSTLNGPIATVFGRALGVDSVEVSSLAVAWRSPASQFPAGSLEFPVVGDCCSLSNDPGPGLDEQACQQNHCEFIEQNQPWGGPDEDGCFLVNDPEAVNNQKVTCLEFNETGTQEICWSKFDPISNSIGSSELRAIMETNNLKPVGAEPIYVDNGAAATVIRELKDKFLGEGIYPTRPDGDTNQNGIPDSWIVVPPIIECQNPGANCGSGAPQKVVGAACLNIHEIKSNGNPKYIKGTFLCPSDVRCDFGGLGAGGGMPGTLRAEPVLVQ